MLNKKYNIILFEILIILFFAIIPLFTTFPYRINIFLSWEGAYRLYLGQVPYRDFGLPMGFAYWIIPAFFFKIFGPFLTSLIKAQVFINIISGLAFRSIFKSFNLSSGARLIAVLVFCISYSFFNFWPWYNHSVIVFQLVGLVFLLKVILPDQNTKRKYLYLVLCSFFIFVSFFTKQDGGALAFLICFFLLVYHSIIESQIKDIILFLFCFAGWCAIGILPFMQYDFGYWFNYGQEPHNSRIQLWDFVKVILGQSSWEKFYLALLIIYLLYQFRSINEFLLNKRKFLLFLFTLGILVQALIFQVTSYTPPDNNIFFHSFAIAFFLGLASESFFRKPSVVISSMLLTMIWWSGAYWKYVERKLERLFPNMTQIDPAKISKSTYVINQNENNISMTKWTFSDLEVFNRIYMPEPTVNGIKRLLDRPEVKRKNAKILNMTELTPLAHVIGYELESGKPLWYHKGVGIFDKEIEQYSIEIYNQKYDLVLFEDIPNLNNFYPYEIQEVLREHYEMVDKFLAPRRPTNATIEVYVRRVDSTSH